MRAKRSTVVALVAGIMLPGGVIIGQGGWQLSHGHLLAGWVLLAIGLAFTLVAGMVIGYDLK